MKFTYTVNILFFAFVPVTLFAGEFKSGESVIVNEPVPADLYIAGGTARVSGPVNGDLILLAGSATVENATLHDLQMGVGRATVRGSVGDDARLAGGEIDTSAKIGGDLVVAGATVRVSGPGIAGDLVAVGGDLDITAPVGGRARLAGQDVRLAGAVFGPLMIRAENVRIDAAVGGDAQISARKIEIGPNARFAGKVTYWSENQPDFGGARATRDESLELESEQGEPENGGTAFLVGAGIASFLWTVLSGALTIAVILFLFPSFAPRSAELLATRANEVIGRGAIYFLASPMGILILLVTIIGIPIALLWLSVYAFSLVFAKAIVALALGALLLRRAGRDATGWALFGVAFGLLFALKLLSIIPLLGFLLGIVWVVLASGLVIAQIAALRGGSKDAGESPTGAG